MEVKSFKLQLEEPRSDEGRFLFDLNPLYNQLNINVPQIKRNLLKTFPVIGRRSAQLSTA